MTTQEFSREFDILYDNITSKGAPGINGYEKSVFLTRAQEELVRKYFDFKENTKQEGIEESMERSIDFSELVQPIVGTFVNSTAITLTDPRSVLYKIPDKVFFITNDIVKYIKGTSTFITVGTPLSPLEYSKALSKAYPEPPKRVTWRILRKDPVESASETYIELIPHSKFYGLTSVNMEYKGRYVKKPRPIVLINIETEPDLSGMNLTVDGVNTISECELNTLVHLQILRRAVELAKSVYLGDPNSFIQISDKPV